MSTEHKPELGPHTLTGPAPGGAGDLPGAFLCGCSPPACLWDWLLTVQEAARAGEECQQTLHYSGTKGFGWEAAAGFCLSALVYPQPVRRSPRFVIRQRAGHPSTEAGRGRGPVMAAAVVAAGRACARGALRAAWRGDGAARGAGGASAGRAAATGPGKHRGRRGDSPQGERSAVMVRTRTSIHVHSQTFRGTSRRPGAQRHIHVHSQTDIRVHTHVHSHTPMCTARHASICASRHPCARPYIHMYMHGSAGDGFAVSLLPSHGFEVWPCGSSPCCLPWSRVLPQGWCGVREV